MSDQATPTPEPAPAPAPKPPVHRADQDQIIANLITEARLMIEKARDDAEIAATLAGRGYDAAALAQGLALQQAAHEAYAARQAAMSAQKKASTAAEQALAAAHSVYMDFRETARANFSDSDTRTALGLTGKTPGDMEKFITTARISYEAAQAEPYQSTLATYGFPAAAIASALAALDALAEASKAQDDAISSAVKTTTARDAAVNALEHWIKKFKSIASIALRAQPTQAKKLGL
ncbi:MAG: hypothetical protein WA821_03335 [Anaerolineales bacterium]